MSLLEDFKTFMLRGNVVDLAVAFVMGAAFNGLITALVADIVTPIIGIAGHFDFGAISYTLNGSTILLGTFLNSLISFITISIAVFFFIIKPISKMYRKKEQAPDTKDCQYCLTKIPIKATRCPNCTSRLA